MDHWTLRASPPPPLARPVRLDPAGQTGPTKGEAAGPHWRRTAKGLYVASTADRSIVEQRILEESCRLPDGGAVTGWAALRLHGAGYFDGRGPDGTSLVPIPLVLPPRLNLNATDGSVVHRERLEAEEGVVVRGIPVTSPLRALFDAARWTDDLRTAVVVLDMALAARVVPASRFADYLATRTGWPGVQQVRTALALTDERTMSPKETALRLIWVLDAGLPPPRCNWPVADEEGRFLGRPDLLGEEHAVVGEFDGAQHRSRSRHRDDLRRDDAFRAVGLEPFRVVGADLDDVPLVLARIRTAVGRAQASPVPRSWRIRANPRPVA